MSPSVIPDLLSQARRLDSWKEIAAYLRRGARTVQRWERREGLPVRRLLHEKLGSVYAFPHELDAWVARRAGRRSPAPPRHSVAVLPFADLTEQRDQACFCDGLAEEVTHALGRLEGLRTAGRSSSAACSLPSADFRAIGCQLGVRSLLLGSVRKCGERVRVAVEWIDAESGFQLWSERYDRTRGDAFLIQDEIAARVSEAVRARLASHTHDCHARGHGHMND